MLEWFLRTFGEGSKNSFRAIIIIEMEGGIYHECNPSTTR